MSDLYDRQSDNYYSDTLIEDVKCCTCNTKTATVQCRPCGHTLVCDKCLIKLCTITFVYNGNKLECFLCRTTVDEFYNIFTGSSKTPLQIQEEHNNLVRQTEEELNDEDAADEEEMFDPELNPIANDPEYKEDNYDIGEITEEEKNYIREINQFIRHGNYDYSPSDSEYVDEQFDQENNMNSIPNSDSVNSIARRLRNHTNNASTSAQRNVHLTNNINSIILDPVQTRSITAALVAPIRHHLTPYNTRSRSQSGVIRH